jgi:chromosome segregation ATPase
VSDAANNTLVRSLYAERDMARQDAHDAREALRRANARIAELEADLSHVAANRGELVVSLAETVTERDEWKARAERAEQERDMYKQEAELREKGNLDLLMHDEREAFKRLRERAEKAEAEAAALREQLRRSEREVGLLRELTGYNP